MNSYKQSAEYAFDVLEHFYNIHHNQILSLGADNIFILLPEEIYKLLEAKDKKGNSIFPTKFKNIKLESYSGSRILFCLRRSNNGSSIK